MFFIIAVTLICVLFITHSARLVHLCISFFTCVFPRPLLYFPCFLPLPIFTHSHCSSVNQKGRVRIIPVDSGMGFDEWEKKYKKQGKPQLSDFFDDEEDSVILRMGNPHSVPSHKSHKSIHQSTQRSLHGMHPEGYDTLDRRAKKNIRDPGGSPYTEMDKKKVGLFSPEQPLSHERRGDLFMKQLAEMHEEEERMTTCLTPYRDGLLYKTRMWAKNDLDNTLENYVTYKRQEDARRRAQFEFDMDNHDDHHYNLDSDEDVEDFSDMYPESMRHYKDRYNLSYNNVLNNAQGFQDRKCRKSKIGEWVPEAMLSPVEEPIEEFVDPMDELQCLVETVSEYLAEKEEEISRYGSLPKSNKSRLSSLGSYRTESFSDDPHNFKEPRKDQNAQNSEQGISGVKNAMSSLFSSLTDKVGGNKQPTPSPQPAAQQGSEPQQSGITKLFSFIPKTKNPAPVAVVSPVDSEKNFAYLSQHAHDASLKGIVQNSNSHGTSVNMPSLETPSKPQQVQGSSVLEKLNPLKLFSSDDAQSSPGQSATQQTFQRDGSNTYSNNATQEKYPKQIEGMSFKNKPTNQLFVSDENVHQKQNAPTESSKPTQEKAGLFGSFSKSFSSLIAPSAPLPSQGPPPVVVYPVYDSTENPCPQKPNDPSLGSKLKLPFFSSENVATQQTPKADSGMLSGFLKFASNEDVSGPKTVQNQAQPHQRPPQVHVSQSAAPQQSTEKGWFSNLFSSTPDPPHANPNVIRAEFHQLHNHSKRIRGQ